MADTRPQANYRPSCATHLGTLHQMDLGGPGRRCGEIAVAPVISSSSVAGGHSWGALLTHRQRQSQEKGAILR